MSMQKVQKQFFPNVQLTYFDEIHLNGRGYRVMSHDGCGYQFQSLGKTRQSLRLINEQIIPATRSDHAETCCSEKMSMPKIRVCQSREASSLSLASILTGKRHL